MSRRSSRRRAIAIPWGVAVLLAAATGFADPPQEAQDLFARGREMRQRGDCAQAIPLFQRAATVYPDGLGSSRNIAECEEALGHYASARNTWRHLRERLRSSSSPRYAGWLDDADAAFARLGGKVATLVVEIVGAAAPIARREVTVTLDGQVVDPAAVGTPIEHDPGRCELVALGPDHRELARVTTDLRAGETSRVDLPVARPLPQGALVPASHESGPAPALRIAGYGALGIGAGGVVGAAVALGVFAQAHSELASRCATYASEPCDPALKPVVARGQTAATAFNVLVAIGGVGVASGVALLTLAPRRDVPVAVSISTNGLLVSAPF